MHELIRCEVLDNSMKKRHGDVIHLDSSKALRLTKAGKVRAIDDVTTELSKVVQRPRKQGRIKTDYIRVVMPYSTEKIIGTAYNREVANADDWILILDHDIEVGLNPFWYRICLDAINRVGHKAGWITCYTNRIGCTLQKAPKVDQSNNDMAYHREAAKRIWDDNRGKIKDCTKAKGRFSGFFILTHKEAWRKAGGFKEEGFFHVDVDYYTKIKAAGYRTYLMQDLYIYHSYFRETLKPYFTQRRKYVER